MTNAGSALTADARELGHSERMLVAAVAVLSHATALRGGYIWLDHAHIEDGLALAEPARWHELFGGGFAGTGFYRPLMALSLSADALVSSGPAWPHLVTLLWHALAAVCVMATAQVLGATGRAASLAGVAFAVHPATSLVANVIAFRSEAMATVFLLLLIVAHRRGRPILAGLALLCGALCKETAWVLGPLFVLALESSRARLPAPRGRDWLARSGPKPVAAGRGKPKGAAAGGASLAREPSARRQVLARVLCWEAGGWCAASCLRLLYAPSLRASHLPLDLDVALGTRLAALAKSTWALIAPVDPSVCDAFPLTGVLTPAALLGLLVFAWLLAQALRTRGTALLLALSCLPILQVVPVMRWWSPHYLYLPLAFASVLGGVALDGWVRRAREPWRRQATWGLVTLCGACAAWSVTTGLRFASDRALWRAELERTPACKEAEFYLGEQARSVGAWALAAEHYTRSLAETPGYIAYVDRAAALQNLGVAHLALGNTEAARQVMTRALALGVDERVRRQTTHNLAVLALQEGEPGEVVRLLRAEMTRADVMPASAMLMEHAVRQLTRAVPRGPAQPDPSLSPP